MSILFRILLIAGALLSFAFILTKIRKSEIRIADSTFWFLFALGIVVLAVFPQVTYSLCALLDIESPVNFVYLVILAILIVRHFMTTVEIAHLRSRLTSLVQEEGLDRHERERGNTERWE